MASLAARLLDGSISLRQLRWAFPAILALGLLLRVAAALGPPNDSYPDEVYQVLEQGYRLAFGRGVVPWEFEVGSRNWVLPGLVGGALAGLDRIGLASPWLYQPVLTCIAIALSLTLIASARRLGTNLAGDKAGLLAALGAAISTPCVLASVKLTPEVLAAYAMLASFAFASSQGARYLALAGLLAGLAFGLRFHYAPALPMIAACAWMRGAKISDLALLIVFAVFSALIFGFVDYLTWGHWFISIYNAIHFNINIGIADSLGVLPFWYYIIVIGPLGLAGILLGALQWTKTWPILVAALLIVVLHSAIGHKENRFIFACHPLLVTAGAIGVALLPRADQRQKIIAAFAICSLAAFGFQMAFPRIGDRYVAEMQVATRLASTDPSLRALAVLKLYILDFPGHYGLGRDVPILLGELRPFQKIEDGFTFNGEERGFTHLIMPASSILPDPYIRLYQGEMIALWRTDPVDLEAALPREGINRFNASHPRPGQ